MVNGKDVRPKSWTNVSYLYDDGETSFISGNYKGNSNTSIGMRWNGDQNNSDDIGYPNQGKYPTWFVLPDWLNNSVLSILADKVKRSSP